MPTTWALGNYARMAFRLRPAAARVVEAADVASGDAVLDVACGTGNAALAAAARGAGPVVGVDLEPALLEQARAAAPDVPVDWRVGDATALPVDDGAFDVVVSAFGVMYAADQPAAAKELARVLRPGGRVALANWVPGSVLPAMGAALAPFLPPPPPGGAPPPRWGDETAARALLTDAGLDVTATEHAALTLGFDTRAAAVAFLVATAGHVVAERPRLESEGRWPQLLGALAGVVAQHDSGRDGAVALRCDYLLVTAHRPR
ncbi:MAG TPA: class I SAM-dependent methyltransferase [Baekduia sp.]|nr:class I SAM-dependent methyltransferase [Baekduia sp.]